MVQLVLTRIEENWQRVNRWSYFLQNITNGLISKNFIIYRIHYIKWIDKIVVEEWADQVGGGGRPYVLR